MSMDYLSPSEEMRRSKLFDDSITALVPCRFGSERVKDKNTRDFAGTSLIKIKLDQLLKVPEIKRIIVSTDDNKIKELVEQMANDKIEIHDRDPHYASSEISNQEFIEYFSRELDVEGHLLWTHVTSPFITEETYSKAIKEYLSNGDYFDSLLSVSKIQEYIWDENKKPVSYNEEKESKCPRTQTLKPLYIINSGIFLIYYPLMKELKDRIGKHPSYFETSRMENIDIDTLDDFKFAERVWG